MPPHCDSLDGPVVKAAARALEADDVDLVLPYVEAAGEEEIRTAFDRARKARMSLDAREVVDLYFFETVVRVHRRGEGAPYMGLKPAGLDVGPVIPVAEHAIESGSAEQLSALLTDVLQHQIKERFDHAMAAQAHASGSVAQGRDYVQAMLGFQVWSHGLYNAMHAGAHGESAEHEH